MTLWPRSLSRFPSPSPRGSSPLRHEWRHVVARQPHPHRSTRFFSTFRFFPASYSSMRPPLPPRMKSEERGGTTRRRQSSLGFNNLSSSGSSLISKVLLLAFGRPPPLLKLIGLNRWDVIALLRAPSGWCEETDGGEDVIRSSLIGILIGKIVDYDFNSNVLFFLNVNL